MNNSVILIVIYLKNIYSFEIKGETSFSVVEPIHALNPDVLPEQNLVSVVIIFNNDIFLLALFFPKMFF